MYTYQDIWTGADETTTVHELLERTRHCEGTALDIWGETMSYQTFHARSDAVAAFLQHKGYGKGDMILVTMDLCCNLYCVITGVIKAGAVVVPLDKDLPGGRLASIIEQTAPVLQITDELAGTMLTEGKERTFCPVYRQMSSQDVLAVLYTSGSTGIPCGIRVISSVMVCSLIPMPENRILSEALGTCTALFNISHPSFAFGFTNFYYTILYGKKFVHIRMGQADTLERIAAKLNENESCFLFFPPSAVLACLENERVRSSFSHVGGVMVGSDIVKPSLMEDMRSVLQPGARIVVLYGSSEVALATARLVVHPEKAHSVGFPTAFSRIEIVDEDRKPLPVGEPGEVSVRGVRVNMGYIGAENQKQKKIVFHPDGTRTWYSGDFGYLKENGELFVLGRMDRIIKHNGFRLDPVEIEECLKRELGVKNAAVKQFERMGRSVLCAFYEHPFSVPEEEIRQKLSEQLPRYSIPERFVQLEKMPLTDRGKLDYRALSLPDSEEPAPYEAPRTKEEKQICEAFAKGMKLSRVGVNESFFALGGDSILAAGVLSMLREEGLEVTVEELFRTPTPAMLAGCARHVAVPDQEKKDSCADDPGRTEELHWKGWLPQELAELAEDERTEAVYPADPSTAFYLFLQESGSSYTRGNRIRFRIRSKKGYTEAAFRERVKQITAKHPVLRSSFVRTKDGKPYQVFWKETEPSVYYKDLHSLSEEARERFLDGFFQVMEEEGSLFSAACFPADDSFCELLLCLRHVLTDGLSLYEVIRELTADSILPGTDAFYLWREKLMQEEDRIPPELQEHYKDFGEKMLLPSGKGTKDFTVRVRKLSLDPDKTRAIQESCAREGVSLVTFAEYCYGKSLLSATGRDWIWFSHLYSGRSPELPGSEAIVGNLFYTMPVRISSRMSVQEFQEELLLPWRYPYSRQNSLYRRLNRFIIEEGLVSNNFTEFGGNVLQARDIQENTRTGHAVENKDGCLTITLRHFDREEENRSYDRIEQSLLSLLDQASSEH